MDKITGELIQNGTPTPDNPVPVETATKIIIKGPEKEIEFEFKYNSEIKEIYKKDDKWYIRKE